MLIDKFEIKSVGYIRVIGPDGIRVSQHREFKDAIESVLADAKARGLEESTYLILHPSIAVKVIGVLASSSDTTPPSVPTGLTATAVSSNQINLSWNASTDTQSAVGGYQIYRDGSPLASTPSLTYQDTSLSPSTLYSYTVAAFDTAGNTSDQSSIASATTQAAAPPPENPLSTTVTLSADASITPTSTEIVTFGLPLSEGVVTDLSQIRVLRNGTEIPVGVTGGLTWHWKDGSFRSVTIQCVVDMTGGDQVLTITNEGRVTANDIVPQTIPAGWEASTTDPQGRALYHPRIYALHDRDYVAASGFLPPYSVGALDDSAMDMVWNQSQFDIVGYPYSSTNVNQATKEAWLFDRVTTAFKLSLIFADNTRRKTMLKHAALSKRMYFNYIKTTGVPLNTGGKGSFTYPTDPSATTGDADGKYIYTQPAKLALGLLGDNTQWDNALIDAMAEQADVGWNQASSDVPYSSEFQNWTERGAGLVGLCMVNAWEITGSQYEVDQINTRISVLKNMQQVPNQFDIDNGWTPLPGYFRHSWYNHEAEPMPYFETVNPPSGVGQTSFIVTSLLDPSDFAKIPPNGTFYLGGQTRTLTGVPTDNGNGTYTLSFSPAYDNTLTVNIGIGLNQETPGMRVDRVGSPWMSENIADFLWQAYHVGFGLDDIPKMLRLLAEAVDNYGFYGVNNGDGTFTKKAGYSSQDTFTTGNLNEAAAGVLYVMSDLATEAAVDRARRDHFYSDQHAPEMNMIFAAGYYFGNTAAQRLKFKQRLDALNLAVMHTGFSINSAPNYRETNWQWRSNGYRTWKWAELNALPILSVVSASVNEGNTNNVVPVTIQLDKTTTEDVTFNWETQNGTATAGVDYVAASGTGTITAGQLSTTVNVTIIGDTTDEPDRTFTVSVSNIRNAVGAG